MGTVRDSQLPIMCKLLHQKQLNFCLNSANSQGIYGAWGGGGEWSPPAFPANIRNIPYDTDYIDGHVDTLCLEILPRPVSTVGLQKVLVGLEIHLHLHQLPPPHYPLPLKMTVVCSANTITNIIITNTIL